MNILHWAKSENSGLFRSTLEIAEAEEKAGHHVCIRQPSEDQAMYGIENGTQLHCIHSQLAPRVFHDNRPKVMWMHGEPLSSVSNGVSMKAIVDLAPMCDAFICMRREELAVWSSIKRTYLVPKGIDLERYKPLTGVTTRLSGEPAVLYVENWRGQRNPLYLCLAMKIVHEKYPKARLHLYNCPGGAMHKTFDALIKHNKWWTFVRSLQGAVDGDDVNMLYNRVDMVVSCLYPLYARGIEAFGAGRAFIGPGYAEPDYPYTCDLNPESMAAAICKCWEQRGSFDFRKWAVERHDVRTTVAEAVKVYERYI